MVEIRFNFDLQKAMQAVCYLLDRLGPTDKVKLMKLLYLVDRQHFIQTGTPITGDQLVAMPWGPVPSSTLNAINGETWGASEVFRLIHVNDNKVELRQSPGVNKLAEDELKTLNSVIAQFGDQSTWKLVRETHRLPEYAECYVEGTSRAIPYERIAKFSGSEARFRLGRAVVTPETAALLKCPFEPDADL